MTMYIKLKESDSGDIVMEIKWETPYAHECERRNIREHTIGKREETICSDLCEFLKEMKSKGRLRY